MKFIIDDIANCPDAQAKLKVNKFAMETTTFNSRNL